MTDERSMEAFEEEVERIAEERGIPFSAALALKNGELPELPSQAKPASPANEGRTPDRKRAVSRADLEELKGGIRELAERTTRGLEADCERRFVEMCMDGTVERRAKEKGIAHRGAWQECMEEAYLPLVEDQQERRELEHRTAAVELAQRLGQDAPTPATTGEVEEAERRLDRRAQAYASEHGVGYEAALEAVLEGRQS